MRDQKLRARDGLELATTLWRADHERVIVIASATAVARRYYRPIAEFLHARDYDVVTFDYRGIGDSLTGPVKASKATMSDWALHDVSGVLDWALANYTSVYYLSHSVGGQLLGLVDRANELKGICTVTSQSGYWGHWSGLNRIAIYLSWHMALPLVCSICGYLPGVFLGGLPLPEHAAREWARWGRHPDYILSAQTGEHDVRTNFRQIEAPLLSFSFADDPFFAPKRAVDALINYFGSTEKLHRHIRPEDLGERKIGHFGFFRETFRDNLWPLIPEWFEGIRD